MNAQTPRSGAAANAAAHSDDVAIAQRRLREQVALPPRIAYVMLLLVSAAMAVVLAALLLTEPFLPPRTKLALAVMLGIAVSWLTFAVWVLRTRRVLLAQHQVLASRMAMAFTTLFTIGAVAWAPWQPRRGAALALVATGVVMMVFAGVRLVQAARRQRALERRRAELELQLQSAAAAASQHA